MRAHMTHMYDYVCLLTLNSYPHKVIQFYQGANQGSSLSTSHSPSLSLVLFLSLPLSPHLPSSLRSFSQDFLSVLLLRLSLSPQALNLSFQFYCQHMLFVFSYTLSSVFVVASKSLHCSSSRSLPSFLYFHCSPSMATPKIRNIRMLR